MKTSLPQPVSAHSAANRWTRVDSRDRVLAFAAIFFGMMLLFGAALAHAEEEAEPVAGDAPADVADAAPAASEEPNRALGRPLPRPAMLEARVAEELDRYEEALNLFETELQEARATTARIIEADYRRRRSRILEEYAQRIEPEREVLRAQRVDAIAEFEAFVERYPNHPEFSADALYRLAVLYFETARDEANLAFAAMVAGEEPSTELDPEGWLRRVSSTTRTLVQRFPTYRFRDGALYLSAMSQEELGDDRGALRALEQLVEEIPDSRLAQEAWFRIGEHYFVRYVVEPQLLHDARHAYDMAAGLGPGRWFDLALYNRGWTHYLLNRYEDALADFEQLLMLYHSEESDVQGDMLEEALVYFATVLAERDWNVDGQTDAEFLMPRVERYLGARVPYSLDVLERLYDRLIQSQPEDEYFVYAADVYRMAIREHFEDAETPRRHLDVVLLDAALGNEEAALVMLAELPGLYGPGSDWYRIQEQEGNLDAMELAEELARDAMLAAGSWHYRVALEHLERFEETGNEGERQQAVARFSAAAAVYDEFMELYPNDEQVYSVMRYRADSLFGAERWLDAALAFEALRDSFLSEEHLAHAASFAVSAWEAHLEDEIRSGRLDPRALPGFLDEPSFAQPVEVADESLDPRAAPRRGPVREPIPALALNLVDAFDAYLEYGVESEELPEMPGTLARDGAFVFHAFNFLDEARRRYVFIMEEFCGERVAGEAAIMLIRSYQVQDDYENMIAWADEVASRPECIVLDDDEAAQFALAIEQYQRAAAYEHAERLRNEGRHEEAALAFLRIVDQFPDSVHAIPSLYAAGSIYEQDLRLYQAAIQQYERLLEQFPDNPYRELVLTRIAVTSRGFFNYERAVSALRELHQLGVDDEELVKAPLMEAGALLSFQQRYEDAARTFTAFVDHDPQAALAPEALYRAIVAWADAGRLSELDAAVTRFGRVYASAPPASATVDVDAAYLDGLRRLREAQQASGSRRQAERTADRILSEFNSRQPQARAARRAAAEVEHERILADIETWRGIGYARNIDDLDARLQLKQEGAFEIRERLEAVVLEYGYAPVSLCAYKDMGQIFVDFYDWIVNYDFPEEIFFVPDLYDEILATLGEVGRAFEVQATEDWVTLYDLAVEEGLRNECVDIAVAGLNRLVGPQYPILKDEERPEAPIFVSPVGAFVPGSAESSAPLFPGADFGEDPEAREEP